MLSKSLQICLSRGAVNAEQEACPPESLGFIYTKTLLCFSWCSSLGMNASIQESIALAKNQNIDFNQQENINMKEQQSVPKDTVALPSGEQVKMSNHMGDQVKTVCQICLDKFCINKMHVHIRLVHNKSPMEYKEQFGNHIKNICDKVFHKCAVCSQILLWEFNKIKDHMYKHKVTHGQYNKQFNVVP